MILSVCPNPSVDCTVEVESLRIGGLNRVDNKVITYSGKALNVAIGVARLGGDSFATGFMFNENGAAFVRSLDNERVKNSFVWNEGNARVNYKIVDRRSMMTEINERGENVSQKACDDLVSLVSELSRFSSVVVISGSLPGGVDGDYYYRLAQAVPKDKKLIVDATGENMYSALKRGVYLVKPNLDELQEITGTHYAGYDDMVEGCKKLIELGAENVLLSLGRKGAILTDGKDAWFCKSASVAVNSTVGAGDGMVAATAVMTENGKSKEEILRCAVAAGTASVTTPGTNLFYRDKYEEIYDKIKVTKL